MDPNRFIAITGASGGGKSTILDALAARGHAVQPEIGRMIVREEMPDGALPWTRPVAFRDLLFHRSVAAYDSWAAERPGLVFFDRTFIEAIAWSRSTGAPVPDEMQHAARTRRFAQSVFVCPPWPEIYRRDAERRHDFAAARADYEANVAAYAAAGYDLIEVPRATPAERAAFILRALPVPP
ncbi:AAA family ATPase [Pontivivens ytuae]|uniref:AAA family ATPase n=1 Tax=Pontivivens ytuae TaxID=2789856 RepID=A0A7S9LQ51_9RHOB|nr:AAA family ATPase [Pontivivens ytuae]QPH53051.1 AAA family ATPase [Pontivivens ytuae]